MSATKPQPPARYTNTGRRGVAHGRLFLTDDVGQLFATDGIGWE